MSRLVVVTGGSGGIGRAVVARFEALGDRVVSAGRRECDVTDEASVDRFFEGLAPDVLVVAAGVADSAPLHRTTLADWRAQLEGNATGAFLCLRAVVPGMRERGSGAVVVVASTAGRVGAPYLAAYTASKHAVVGLVRAVAAEVAGSGVTVNAVCPTFVATPMTDRSIANIVDRTGRTPEEAEAVLAGAAPLGRLLRPDEVAAAAVWLASPEAAAISGQTLVLDGGGIQT